MASVSARDAFVSPLRLREVSEPVGAVEDAAAGLVPSSIAGVGGNVADGGESAGLGTAGGAGGKGGGGSAPAGFGPPCERRAAERVMSRVPHPGQVTMLSGSESGPIGVLQRGQFMSRGPVVERRPGGRV